jgi:hypothetical protein
VTETALTIVIGKAMVIEEGERALIERADGLTPLVKPFQK